VKELFLSVEGVGRLLGLVGLEDLVLACGGMGLRWSKMRRVADSFRKELPPVLLRAGIVGSVAMLILLLRALILLAMLILQ
jgi:hypothetical protein